MEETQAETTTMLPDGVDTSLPAVVASLEMLTVNTNLPSRRKRPILRKRTPNADDCAAILNRRCSLRPKKRTCSEMENNSGSKQEADEVQVKDYYLNRKIKRRLNNLETIYEENDIDECNTYMSTKRYKRMIQFQQNPTDSKLKKRRAKIKKVFGSKINFKRRCASMQMLLDKLSGIKVESPAKVDNELNKV